MKKKKTLSILSLLCVAVMCIFCGCVSGQKGPQFLEGALTETELGVDILISELVELDHSVDYEFTITDPSNKEKDYSSRKIWIPEDIGKYTLTYSILEGKNKGVATHTVEVVGRAIEWSFDNTSPYIYQKGTELEFADLFDDMNVLVQSDYPYTLSMMSVLIDGVRTLWTRFTPKWKRSLPTTRSTNLEINCSCRCSAVTRRKKKADALMKFC